MVGNVDQSGEAFTRQKTLPYPAVDCRYVRLPGEKPDTVVDSSIHFLVWEFVRDFEAHSSAPQRLTQSARQGLLGLCRLSSSSLAEPSRRATMASCLTGAFKYLETGEHLLWWHPNDRKRHPVWNENGKMGNSYIGATIRRRGNARGIPEATTWFRIPMVCWSRAERCMWQRYA